MNFDFLMTAPLSREQATFECLPRGEAYGGMGMCPDGTVKWGSVPRAPSNGDLSRGHRQMGICPEGTDAPICQDSRSRSQVCGLARSVVCHHALKDLAGEKAFETADDLPFGPPFSGASFDVVEGW